VPANQQFAELQSVQDSWFAGGYYSVYLEKANITVFSLNGMLPFFKNPNDHE